MHKYVFLLGCLIAFIIYPIPSAAAPAQSEVEQLREQLEDVRRSLDQLQRQHKDEMDALENKVRILTEELETQRRQLDVESDVVYEGVFEPVSPPSSFQPQPFGSGVSWQNFNPDISVIGDFLAHYTSHEDGRPDDEFVFRELEINFSGVLDPYARADVTIAIEKEFEEEDHEEDDGAAVSPRRGGHGAGFEIDLEEAYLTALTLPYGLQARVGRMREDFGKINHVHLHALPWVDYPLMIKNYFGDEGLIGDGIEISWLAPTSHYLELIYQAFNNSNESSFAGEEYDDFVHLARMRNLFDISDATTLELGGTVATGPNDDGHGGERTWLEGIDLTLKWRPPQEALYRGLAWQTELLLSQKDTEERGRQDTWALYSSLEYQLNRRWIGALRYDYSEFPDFERYRENGYSAYLTFKQSEFVFWRLGYMFVDRNFADPVDEDEHLLWVQLNFGLGPHRAHEY